MLNSKYGKMKKSNTTSKTPSQTNVLLCYKCPRLGPEFGERSPGGVIPVTRVSYSGRGGWVTAMVWPTWTSDAVSSLVVDADCWLSP